MSKATTKYGRWSSTGRRNDAAIAWATREAVMRDVPITLLNGVTPVVVGWPVGQLYADMPEWQKDNSQYVIEQARKTLTTSLGESKPPATR
jgi:hypothetical protein